jgi:hypothetical protein
MEENDNGVCVSLQESHGGINKMLGTKLKGSEKSGIRSIIELHSSSTSVFKGKKDIFYSVEEVGKGVWGLRAYHIGGSKMKKTLKEMIIEVMYDNGGEATLKKLYEEIGRMCGSVKESSIRSIIEKHSSDSDAYREKNEDLFYSVEGKGKGVWGLRAYHKGGSKVKKTLKEMIIEVMYNKGGKATLKEIYQGVCRMCGSVKESSIRNIIETHSSDSDAYREKNEDLFYSVEGKGKGIWGLRAYHKGSSKMKKTLKERIIEVMYAKGGKATLKELYKEVGKAC